MKKKLYSVLSFIVIVAVSSCEKNDNAPKPTANVTVINAAVDAGPIKVAGGAGGVSFPFAQATAIAYNASGSFASFPGSNTIKVVSSTDTTKFFFNRTLDLQPISTLYIAGQSPVIDTIFRTETNFPYLSNYNNPDNNIAIRFVNLSPNSSPLNIKISTGTTNEVSDLAYKGITEFKKYVALTTTPNYVFEVRDAATNTLRTSFTLNTNSNRYKTVSLVVRGLMGTTSGTNAFGVLLVTYN